MSVEEAVEDVRQDTGIPSKQFWWLAKDGECGALAMEAARAVEASASLLEEANLRHARLYENVELAVNGRAMTPEAIVRQALISSGLVSLNVVASAIDTLAAKIAKNKPRPNFVTSGGSWKHQRMARKLDKWCRGLFYETKIHTVARRVFLDSCIYGTGLLHVFFGHDKRLEVERVLPTEVFVDDNDGQYGKPQSIYRRKAIHKSVLAAMFPAKAALIRVAQPKVNHVTSALPSEHLEVWEAWHRPSGDDTGDGRHVIATDGIELLCEPYEHCLPFVVLRARERVVGFWGRGDAEVLLGIQLELNRLIRSISEQLRRKGRGRIFVPMGSKVEPAHLTNGIGDIVKYAGGVPPTVDNGSVVSADEFQQVDRLYERALQEVGVSQLSAASKKPSGLDAAVALREFSEIESERFSLRHLAWEDFFLEFAELAIELMESRKGHGYKVKVPGRRKAEEVDFADVDLDRDSYVIQMFPVSSLPQTPSARYQRVKEMLADGFVTPPVAKRLLDFPDLEAEGHLGNAALDDADATISAILDEDVPKYEGLEPYQDFKLLLERAVAAYLFARHNNCEEERLEMLQLLINDASSEVAKLSAPPPGPEMGAPAPAAPPMLPSPVGGDLNVNVSGAGPAPAVPPVVA